MHITEGGEINQSLGVDKEMTCVLTFNQKYLIYLLLTYIWRFIRKKTMLCFKKLTHSHRDRNERKECALLSAQIYVK